MRVSPFRFGRLTLKSEIALAAVTLLLVLSTVPFMPWRPACRCPTVWTGDLRDVYVDRVAYWLQQDNIYFWRFGDLMARCAMRVTCVPYFRNNDLGFRVVLEVRPPAEKSPK